MVVVTCEHAGNRVPARYTSRFRGARARTALASHRGYDPGALGAARALARRFGVPLHACLVTRLLVEVNRSVGHPQLYSEFTRGLDRTERQALLNRYYHPHRLRIETAIARLAAARRPVLHLAVHSFTPRLGGRTRRADIGLLYDPARSAERTFCLAWQRALATAAPALRVRRNYPYRGAADGLATVLRRRFPDTVYVGVELEINQARLTGGRAEAARVVEAVGHSLETLRRR